MKIIQDKTFFNIRLPLLLFNILIVLLLAFTYDTF